jgi:hypothetical protein
LKSKFNASPLVIINLLKFTRTSQPSRPFVIV